MLDFVRTQVEGLLIDLEDIVQRNRARLRAQPRIDWSRPAAATSWRALAWDALDIVLGQWRLGFGEARHILFSSTAHRKHGRPGYHFADVFQRALLADILADAVEAGAEALRPALDFEAAYLLSCRLAPPVGGWSYFPDLPDEPADADDLGQVMQVLLRSGYRTAVDQHARAALEVLLGDNSYPDGSFDTWIIPAAPRSAGYERQAQAARMLGGNRTSEVIANLLYALVLYDAETYRGAIEQGVCFLEAEQNADGSWHSHWYCGPFYGTFVCLRLLAATVPDSAAIVRGIRFLAGQQLADGGWGFGEGGDPLSTSLALLALAAAGDPGMAAVHLDAALDALRETRRHDGSWPRVAFISLPQLASRDVYASRTISTAYVLKAALAVARWRDGTSAVDTSSTGRASYGASRLRGTTALQGANP